MSPAAVVLAVAPSILLVTYFYWRDRYEREPMPYVATAYGLGVYAMVAAQGIATAAETLFPATWWRGADESARLFDSVVLSGVVEEVSKLVVLGAAVFRWDEFDEPLDGVVYGVAVGAGFAMVENLIYVHRWGIGIAWMRAVFAVPAHALFGGTMGYYLGRAKFAARMGSHRRWLDRALCFLLPTACHGAYNYALHHRLDWKIWTVIATLSFGMWIMVLEDVYKAQRASPYRPKV